MPRSELPRRRLHHCEPFVWPNAPKLSLSVGFDCAGRVREVFVHDDGKTGTDVEALLQDGCVLISFLLQQDGMDVCTLAGKVGREGVMPGGAAPDDGDAIRAASMFGGLLAQAAAIEAREGPEMRATYEASQERKQTWRPKAT